jgi:hypothetical protein
MGVTKEIIKTGTGSQPRAGQEVTVHCTGYGKDRDLTKKFWCKWTGCVGVNRLRRTVCAFPPRLCSAVIEEDVIRLLAREREGGMG